MLAIALAFVAVLASNVPPDDMTVLADKRVDFSAFKTFVMHEGKRVTPWQELGTPLAVQRLDESIRASLVGKGLKETSASPDLVVSYRLSTVDYNMNKFGVVRPLNNAGGVRLGAVSYTEGMLVIDLQQGEGGSLVWRGVYYEYEVNGTRLPDLLPKDAAALLAKYPARKK